MSNGAKIDFTIFMIIPSTISLSGYSPWILGEAYGQDDTKQEQEQHFQKSSVNTFKAIVIFFVKDGIVGVSIHKLSFPLSRPRGIMLILFFSYKNKIAIFQQNMLIMPSGT